MSTTAHPDPMTEGAALDDVLPGIDAVLDAEIREHLDRWRTRYRGRRRAERRALLLFALEREQIVTVAYRDEVMAARIDALDVPEALRAHLRRAMAWVWRDEALHTEWVRGQLRHERRPVPALVLLGHQAFGMIGGWISTTRMHPAAGRWTADQLARALVWGARLTRRLSPALARELDRKHLGDYARLNLALERTAERSWLRLGELAGGPEEAEAIARIADDERRHREVFAAVAAMIDPGDRLAPGADVDAFARRLAAISPWFASTEHLPADLPGSPASAPAADHRVHARSDAAGRTRAQAVTEAVTATGVLDDLPPGGRVAIRTAFMYGYHRDDRSIVADPEALGALTDVVRAAGAADVAVIEVPSIYDRYVANRSVDAVATYFGLVDDRWRLVDGEADQVPCRYPRGLGRTTISRTWLEADLRIVLAPARTDPVEHGHLALCTLEGTGGRVEQTVYFGRYTDFRSATMMVLDLAPPHLAVVDAWGPVADGPVGVMGSDRPCHPRRIYAGVDPLAVDVAVLGDMGARDLRLTPMVATAAQWLGTELPDPEVHGDAGPWGGGYRGPGATAWDRLVCRMAFPVYTYGGSQGARFLPAFDPDAFPDLGRPRWDLRLNRAAARRVFGLHPPAGGDGDGRSEVAGSGHG